MARNVFSVPIFFIVFRETLEAAIIVSVLLGLVEQIVHQDPALLPGAAPPPADEKEKVRDDRDAAPDALEQLARAVQQRRGRGDDHAAHRDGRHDDREQAR